MKKLLSLLLIGITALPYFWGGLGTGYLVAALALGGLLLALAWRLRRETTPRRAAVLFHYSLAYLALLFAAVALDAAL